MVEVNQRRISHLIVCLSAIMAISALLMALAFGNSARDRLKDQNSFKKIILGPNKIPFCMPSQYVTGTGQLSDGSWRLDATMFLPDLSSEAVYDKLHPIIPSPVFQSPERIAFEHSILQIEVTSSFQGKNDPTGEISQNQGMKNSLQIDHPSTNDPIDGFKEYDDKSGNPDIYFDADGKPRFITCFRNACGIGEILNNSISIEISLDKVAVTKSRLIIEKLNRILESTKCP